MSPFQSEKVIREIVLRHVPKDRVFVFLFGSRADRESMPASDYDIGLYGDQKIPLGVIAKIQDELDNYPIPVHVDIVDFSSVTEEFKRLALKQVQVWNRPKSGLKLI